MWVEVGTHLPNFRRNIWIHKNDFANQIKNYGEVGIYTTAYSYKEQGAKDKEIFGNLYLDFDHEDFEKVRKDVIRTLSILRVAFRIDIDAINIYFSGKKGIHVIIPADILGITPKENLNDDFKAVAKGINSYLKNGTLDLQIYDNARLLRIPNSRHQDTGYYKVALTEQEVRELKHEDIMTLATNKRTIKRKKPLLNPNASDTYKEFVDKFKYDYKQHREGSRDDNITYTPPCIVKLWKEGAPQGKRNNSLAALVSHFYQLGHDEEKAYDLAYEWGMERCVPALKDKEIERTVQSIYTGGYQYGCQTLSDLAGCFKECRFYAKRGREV